MSLYPLKFETIYKDKIWGGNKLKNLLNKDVPKNKKIGETWEISGVAGNISIVKNGVFAGNSLQEMIELYMGDLVGDIVYEKFGLEFPLLIKFIDASDDLSIQVHPTDEIAFERHNTFGKTEMWYVLEADNNAQLISGFNKDVSKQEYISKLENNKLADILNFETVKKGDVFFIPSGRVHAICKGILLAEIQQTSDITYRIYDWDRLDDNGNSRELHTDLALDVIDLKKHKNYKTEYSKKSNNTSEIIKNEYFTTNILEFNSQITKDIYNIDSFIIYIATEGETDIIYNKTEKISLKTGETILIPAELYELTFIPHSPICSLLEVYVQL
jgi:mannose-6-phosphate isomerase